MPYQPSLNQQELCRIPLCLAFFLIAMLVAICSPAQFEETAFGQKLQSKIDSIEVVLAIDSNYIPQIPIEEPIATNLDSDQRLLLLAEKIALTDYYDDLGIRKKLQIILSSIMPDDLEQSPKHRIWWHKLFSLVLMDEADIPGSIRELEEARSLALNIKDRKELCNIERMKAFTYHYMNNDITAKEHFQHVVDDYWDVGGDDYILSAYMLIELDCEEGHLEAARKNLDKFNLIEPKEGSDMLSRFRTLGYAVYYLASENCDSALVNFEKLFEIYKKRPDKTWPPWLLSQISLSHLCAGEVKKAIDAGERGLGISLDNNFYKEEIDNREALYMAYLEAKKPEEALEQLQRVVELKEDIGNAKKSIAIANTIMQNEFQRRAVSEQLLRQEEERVRDLEYTTRLNKEKNRRNIFLLSMVLVIVLSGGLWSRLRYIRRSKNVIEEEKERSDKLLLNILPQKVAEELKEKGESEARLFEETTVLFTDFQQFTEISEKFSPSELVDEINACFKAFDQIIEKYNIEKIKTIGDAYMAAAGLNVPRTSSPKDVVLAALEMQEFVERRKELRSKEGMLSFQMRAGIHTGPVVAGIVGVKKFQYDIWGDTVNTASRMESGGQVGKVNISEDTYAFLKDDPELMFTARGKVQVKGKGALEMYFVSRR